MADERDRLRLMIHLADELLSVRRSRRLRQKHVVEFLCVGLGQGVINVEVVGSVAMLEQLNFSLFCGCQLLPA
jgi:hypothetical protein